MVKNSFVAWRHRARRGIAAVEFALTLPIWIALLLGVSDGSYFLLVNERVDRIAYTITDIVTQYQTISLANLNDIAKAAGQLMSPFSFTDGQGSIIVTSVFQPPSGAPIIEWQYKYPTATAQISKIGATSGAAAVLPNGLTLNANDNVIVSEIYYTFTPMFLSSGLFNSGVVYRVAVYKPRLSPLVTPPT